MVRKVLYVISTFMFVFVFTACSGYVQTNKLPNNVKYNLPKKSSSNLRNETLNTKELSEFSATLEEFFGKKRISNDNNDEEAEQRGIYQIGIEKEYFK